MSSLEVGNDDSLDALLSRLMATAPQDKEEMRPGDSDNAKPSESSHRMSGQLHTEDNHPWRTISDQISDEISQQIFEELDRQLDAQLMAELEKCQEEQTRQLDEELDKQLQEQLDTMLEASFGSTVSADEHEAYYDNYPEDEYGYSSDEDYEDIRNLPWSVGGEGGIAALGLRQVPLEENVGMDSMSDMPMYTEEELQGMVDTLYGKGGRGKSPAPGAWGRARWRPGGNEDGTT